MMILIILVDVLFKLVIGTRLIDVFMIVKVDFNKNLFLGDFITFM